MRPTKTINGKQYSILDPLDRFTEGKGRRYEINGVNIAVFLFKHAFIAVGGECPHEGTSLADGWIADDCVTCPRHGWQFDTKTGEGRLDGTCNIPIFETAVLDQALWVHIPSSSGTDAEGKYSDWDV